MEAEQKMKKTKGVFWYPTQKKSGPGRMAQTPRAGASDSVSRFCCYWCSTLFNYDSNLFVGGTFLMKLLPPLDNRPITANPKRDLRFEFECSSFENLVISHHTNNVFVPKNCTILVCFHPLDSDATLLISI